MGNLFRDGTDVTNAVALEGFVAAALDRLVVPDVRQNVGAGSDAGTQRQCPQDKSCFLHLLPTLHAVLSVTVTLLPRLCTLTTGGQTLPLSDR
jgi:hypothetical protein